MGKIKKAIFGVIILFFGLAVLGAMVGTEPQNSSSSTSASTPATTPAATPATTPTPTSANTNTAETTSQFSESKKEELIGYMKQYYGAKEVTVVFIPPSNPSSNGLISIDYYTDVVPTKKALHNNIADILALSNSLAKESGISNPDISLCAMMMDETPLGIGNYYSSTRKTDIDVSACP